MIFTAATQEYANRVVNLLDPDSKLISYRLYRQHTTMVNGELVKVRFNKELIYLILKYIFI